MQIIAGLGNPGRQYENTRHNSGFAALDILARRLYISVETKRFNGLVGTGFYEGKKVLLVKPQTLMNLSGQCISQVCNYYNADPESDLVVMYDDISLDPGRIRVRKSGSAGGHNGMKNIIALLGTQNFTRIRIGVGAKPEGYDLADYVLGHFSPEDRPLMNEAFDRAAAAAFDLLTDRPEDVMSRYNGS